MPQGLYLEIKNYMFKLSEHQIQDQIMGYLRSKGWYVDRMNSGRMQYRNSHGKIGYVKLHPVGTPDIMAFKKKWVETESGSYYKTHLLYVEVKAPGNKPTRLQTMKMQELTEHGAICLVATSIEDLAKVGI